MRYPTPNRLSAPVLALALALASAALPACKPKGKAGLTPAERCRKGCTFRVRCIEELALDKSVTDANREHVRRAQEKSHARYVDYCVKACDAGKARFQAFARCGVDSKDCDAYFRCESASVKAATETQPPRRSKDPR